MNSSKQQTRKYFKNILLQQRGLDISEKLILLGNLQKNLISFLGHQSSGFWAGFKNLPEEPELDLFALAPEINWLFPKVKLGLDGEILNEMDFVKCTQFKMGAFGVMEPAGSIELVETALIQGYLIPGLAFDRNGTRLGRGKGFYDRALSGVDGVKIGIAWHCQISDIQLPRERHDVVMDFIITEREVIEVKKV